jgi:hypothetical protein
MYGLTTKFGYKMLEPVYIDKVKSLMFMKLKLGDLYCMQLVIISNFWCYIDNTIEILQWSLGKF